MGLAVSYALSKAMEVARSRMVGSRWVGRWMAEAGKRESAAILAAHVVGDKTALRTASPPPGRPGTVRRLPVPAWPRQPTQAAGASFQLNSATGV